MSTFESRTRKLQGYCFTLIRVLFGILLVGILIATLLPKNRVAENPFPNAAPWSNALYYLLALAAISLLIAGYLLVRARTHRALSKRGFVLLIGGIALITLVLQTVVVVWLPELTAPDFRNVREAAIDLARGGSFLGNGYFYSNPNNVNITILFAWIYRVFSSWSAVLWIGALLTNISAVLAAWTVLQLTQSRLASTVTCILGEVLVALSWRGYFPYTDSFAMPFTIATVAVFFSHLRPHLKAPLVLALGMIGAWIKITALIPLVAIAIYAVIRIAPHLKREYFKLDRSRKTATKLISLLLCAVLVAGGVVMGSALRKHYDYTPSEDAKGWQYFMMMGADASGLGTVSSKEFGPRWAAIQAEHTTKDARMDACLDTVIEWTGERGVLGNLEFLLKKLHVAYNDGQFHSVQAHDEGAVTKNALYDIYCANGAHASLTAGLLQWGWDMILLLMMADVLLGLLAKRGHRTYALLRIAILGVTLYVMLFENRSKYLFMFLPLYACFAGLMLHETLRSARELWERRSARSAIENKE